MKSRFYFVIVGLIFFLQNSFADFSMRWNSEIHLNALSDLPAALNDPHYVNTSVGLTNAKENKTVNTCREYFEYIKKDFYPINNREIAAESFFIERCGVLSFLEKGINAKFSYVRNFDLQKEYGYLPADIVFPDIIKGKEIPGFLKDIYPDIQIDNKDNASSSNITLSSNKAGLTSSISILAWGDYNHDGFEDMLILVATYSYHGEGTFRMYHLYVLTQKNNERRNLGVVGFKN